MPWSKQTQFALPLALLLSALLTAAPSPWRVAVQAAGRLQPVASTVTATATVRPTRTPTPSRATATATRRSLLPTPTERATAPARPTSLMPTATPPPATSQPQPSPTPAPTEQAVEQAVETVAAGRVVGDRVNVRSAPSTSAGIVGQLQNGDAVEVVGRDTSGAWYRIRHGESIAWVSAALVEMGAPETAAAGEEREAEPEQTTGPATASAAETPATDAPAVEGPAVAESAVAESAAPDAADPSASPDATADIAAPAGSPIAYTQPDRMNARRGPGTSYEIAASLARNTALEITGLSPDGEWYQVRLQGQDEPLWVSAGLTTTQGALDGVKRLAQEELPPLPEPAAAPVAAPAAAPVVAAPPPAGGSPFAFGIQAHMLGGGISEAVNATADLGFTWLKQQVEWKHMERSSGALDFSELRRIVDAAGGRGINVLFSVVNAPEWAREAGFDPSVGGPPADPQSYANFVGRLAGDFCGSALKAIEVWNEQNLHYEWGNKPLSPADYMALLRASYNSIKSACPSMLVISGALTPTGPNEPWAMDDFAYLEGMYQNGLAAYADGIGAHPSGYNVPPHVGWQDACATIQGTGSQFNGPCDTPHHSWSFRSTLEGYRNIMVVYGDANKSIWVTEFGWATGPAVSGSYFYANDNSPEEQAAWTVEAFNMMRSWGWVGPAILWNLNFRVVADGTEKAQWGVVRNDYTPMPIYSALKAMPK